jgi:hypothetical protein
MWPQQLRHYSAWSPSLVEIHEGIRRLLKINEEMCQSNNNMDECKKRGQIKNTLLCASDLIWPGCPETGRGQLFSGQSRHHRVSRHTPG